MGGRERGKWGRSRLLALVAAMVVFAGTLAAGPTIAGSQTTAASQAATPSNKAGAPAGKAGTPQGAAQGQPAARPWPPEAQELVRLLTAIERWEETLDLAVTTAQAQKMLPVLQRLEKAGLVVRLPAEVVSAGRRQQASVDWGRLPKPKGDWNSEAARATVRAVVKELQAQLNRSQRQALAELERAGRRFLFGRRRAGAEQAGPGQAGTTGQGGPGSTGDPRGTWSGPGGRPGQQGQASAPGAGTRRMVPPELAPSLLYSMVLRDLELRAAGK